MKLNKDQKKLTGDIFGNLAVGWFGAGIIVPTFTKNIGPQEYALYFLLGFGSSLIFYFLAIFMLKR